MKNYFCMSKCSLFLVDEDLFFNFLYGSYSLVTGIKTKLLKRGAKDATRMARSTQEHGISFQKKMNYRNEWIYSYLNIFAHSLLTFEKWRLGSCCQFRIGFLTLWAWFSLCKDCAVKYFYFFCKLPLGLCWTFACILN